MASLPQTLCISDVQVEELNYIKKFFQLTGKSNWERLDLTNSADRGNKKYKLDDNSI